MKILVTGAADLKAYIESSPEIKLDGCAGKIVSGSIKLAKERIELMKRYGVMD